MLDTFSFLFFCKGAGLSLSEMDEMTVGMCLDYVGAYYEFKDPNSKTNTTRTAGQADFDNF